MTAPAPLTRRRFIVTATLAATAAALNRPLPAKATPVVWTGRAFGAEARIEITGSDPATARRHLRACLREIARVERAANLCDPGSALVRLNRTGVLINPPATLAGLVRLADRLNRATGGTFDPSVQPLFQTLAATSGRPAPSALAKAVRRIGWQHVEIADDRIRLDRGMALTFNGLAQGWAADRVAEVLASRGCRDVLIDTGEIRALGAPVHASAWRAAVAAPDGRLLRRVALADRALATSAPAATVLDHEGRVGHILDPHGARPPRWALVAVSAPQAAVADGLSTAFCLMDGQAQQQALDAFAGARIEARLAAGGS